MCVLSASKIGGVDDRVSADGKRRVAAQEHPFFEWLEHRASRSPRWGCPGSFAFVEEHETAASENARYAIFSHATGKNCRASSLPIAQRAQSGMISMPLLLA
jgi:hypothetical protein